MYTREEIVALLLELDSRPARLLLVYLASCLDPKINVGSVKAHYVSQLWRGRAERPGSRKPIGVRELIRKAASMDDIELELITVVVNTSLSGAILRIPRGRAVAVMLGRVADSRDDTESARTAARRARSSSTRP